MVRGLLALAWLALAAPPAAAAVYTWVDEEGVTHIADDPSAVPESARTELREGRQGLDGLWEQGVVDSRPPPAAPQSGGKSFEEQRVDRVLSGAVEDIERGETARAYVSLRSALRLDARSAEAHWYLARLDRQRGRYESAEVHLREFVRLAGAEHAEWREVAEQRLAALADERRLADESRLPSQDLWIGVEHPHFRVSFDAELGKTSRDYAATVLRYLEQAYAEVGENLGAVPLEPLGVMLYGKAAYLRAHRHRFSFQTVGFFDGRIHVVSAAHPSAELRALLFHEYTHAVFREQTGGDRPFWLNEGLAELAERASRGHRGLSRSERSLLRRRIDAGRWLNLERLAPSFAGLEDEDARAAYLVSAAAASWLIGRTDRAQRGQLLKLLGEGRSYDDALRNVLGLTTDQADRSLQAWLREEFPVALSPE